MGRQGGGRAGCCAVGCELGLVVGLANISTNMVRRPFCNQARAAIEDELGMPLGEAFEWIDLDHPLGSASISQVGCASVALLCLGSSDRCVLLAAPICECPAFLVSAHPIDCLPLTLLTLSSPSLLPQPHPPWSSHRCTRPSCAAARGGGCLRSWSPACGAATTVGWRLRTRIRPPMWRPPASADPRMASWRSRCAIVIPGGPVCRALFVASCGRRQRSSLYSPLSTAS